MRTLLGLSLLLAGCTSRPSSPPVTTGAFTLDEVVQTTDDAMLVQINRREVPLREMPLAPLLAGLPMTGLATIAIDLSVPVTDDAPDHRKAVGTVAFGCPAGCTIGDDIAKLQPRGAAGGIAFGHIAFDELDVRAVIDDGRVTLTRWHGVSKDLELQVALTIELTSPLADSVLDGCVRFKATPALAARDPKTAAVIATTGASVDADGMSSITVEGSIGTPKLLAQPCGDAPER